MKKKLLRSFLLLLISSNQTALPQATTAAISGVVKDITGAILPGSTVTVKNTDTGIARTIVTDDQGRYRASNLSLGNYEVTASLTGFQTEVRSGIKLTVGREAIVDFTLKVGEITEKVVVTGEAPLVETTKSEISGLVTTEQINALPLNSRDFSQLITLQAGAIRYLHAQGSLTSSLGARIAISGARTSANIFTLDGTDINTTTGYLPSNVAGATLGVDTVREFKVLTSNYSAQYGRAAGANIIAISRSGTNDFHGTIFEYHRNDNLDARNFFDDTRPEFKRNQFGFSLGGPIAKDKSFFFGSYEGLRERLGLTGIARVPTASARQGRLPDRVVTVDPKVKPYLDLYPLPNGRDFGDGTAEFLRADSQRTDEDYLTIRIDHQFSDKHSLFGRFTLDNSKRFDPPTIPLFATVIETRSRFFTLETKSIFSPNFVNTFRFGLNRSAEFQDLEPMRDLDPSLSFVSGRPFGGIDPGSGITALTGFSADVPRSNFLTVPQWYNDVDYTKGRHSIKAGVMIERFIFNKFHFSRYGGIWTFGSIVDFLTNATPRRLRIQGPESQADPFRTLFQTLVGWYIQDDIRLRPNLTLNIGLRHEFTTTPTEKFGRLSNVRFVLDPQPTIGEPLYDNPAFDDLAPRLGFAWDPTGSGNTSIRGGFGIFFEPLSVKQFFNSISRVPPFWSDIDPPSSRLRGLFPRIDRAVLEQLAGGPQAIHTLDFKLKSPYMIHYSLSIQRKLISDVVLTATYTGTRGVHLTSRHAFDVPVPDFLPDGRVFYPQDRNQFMNPNFGRFQWYSTGAFSNYHGLKLTGERRFSQGFQFQASYTLSKAIDTQSGHLGGEVGGPTVLNPFSIKQDRALAATDARHNLVMNYSFELPFGTGRKFGQNLSGFVDKLISGWQINGIVNIASGNPTTLESNGRLTHPLIVEGGRPDLRAGASNNPVLGGPDQYFDPGAFEPQKPGFYGTVGRNTLIGPGLVMFDFSLMKNIYMGPGEGKKIQFRAEFFNLFNRANFGFPETELFDSRGRSVGGAGRITRTITSSRQVQFALRFEF